MRVHSGKIAIVGAGILGRLCAFRLLESGYQVSLFDKYPLESPSNCSNVAGGMIAPFAELETCEPIISELGIGSLKLWPAYRERIQKCTPRRVFYQQKGSLVLSFAQDQSEWQSLKDKVSNSEYASQMETLDLHQLATLEPDLSSRFEHALYFPIEAQIDPKTIMEALADYLSKSIDFHQETITSVSPHQVATEFNHYTGYETVIDCRGLGLQREGHKLRGVRGEIIHIFAPEVTLNRPIRVMHPRYPLYVIPRPNHEFIVGATQIESEDYRPISVRSNLELLSASFALHSGFAEATILESRTHCRPAYMDNLPMISTEQGLITINGLFRHGYLMAPTLVESVMIWLRNKIIDSKYKTLFRMENEVDYQWHKSRGPRKTYAQISSRVSGV